MELLKYINEEILPFNMPLTKSYNSIKTLNFIGTVSNIDNFDTSKCDIGSTVIDTTTYCVYAFDGIRFIVISSIGGISDGIT